MCFQLVAGLAMVALPGMAHLCSAGLSSAHGLGLQESEHVSLLEARLEMTQGCICQILLVKAGHRPIQIQEKRSQLQPLMGGTAKLPCKRQACRKSGELWLSLQPTIPHKMPVLYKGN